VLIKKAPFQYGSGAGAFVKVNEDHGISVPLGSLMCSRERCSRVPYRISPGTTLSLAGNSDIDSVSLSVRHRLFPQVRTDFVRKNAFLLEY
jgi:hypothetical protein